MRILSSTLAHNETVEQAGLAASRFEPGLKHQGVIDIVTGGLAVLLRIHRAEPTLFPVQQTAEATTTVHPGCAAPVYGAAPGDESRRKAVADEGVVIDRGVW